MKIIKLFVIHILLLSSFQTFAEELRITTADVLRLKTQTRRLSLLLTNTIAQIIRELLLFWVVQMPISLL
ncbi:hypothetical protein BSPWISOXPB_9239 [uncultured Gammaproteobacteria bacterium]|nr:hypothetical protein BSPWISOXPB_9239 [uncultured Gammaproteobacteria bacterium]